MLSNLVLKVWLACFWIRAVNNLLIFWRPQIFWRPHSKVFHFMELLVLWWGKMLVTTTDIHANVAPVWFNRNFIPWSFRMPKFGALFEDLRHHSTAEKQHNSSLYNHEFASLPYVFSFNFSIVAYCSLNNYECSSYLYISNELDAISWLSKNFLVRFSSVRTFSTHFLSALLTNRWIRHFLATLMAKTWF